MKAPPKEHKNVLVVDDDPDIVEYLSLLLTKFGYNPTSATTTSEALSILKNTTPQTAPSVAIVDLVLGSENGITLADQLVEASPELRILLISGYADNVVQSELLPNGKKAAFLSKRFTAAELKKALAELAAS
jgi:two-component system, response regulator RegA